MKKNGLLWLFIGADNKDELEAAGNVVLDCIDSYLKKGDFRDYMEYVFAGNYGGNKMFRGFLDREKKAGDLAKVGANTTIRKIRY